MDRIAEHQQTGKEPAISGEADKDIPISKMVRELMMRSKRGTRELRTKLKDDYEFLINGKQWSVGRPSWRFSEVVNIALGTVLHEVSIETDARPKVEFVGAEPSDMAFADILKQVNDANWEKSEQEGYGWHARLQRCIFKKKYTPVVFVLVEWNPALCGGQGDIGWKNLDTNYCYWDLAADGMNDSRYFIYACPYPTAKLRAMYPGKDIKPDIDGVGYQAGGLSDVDTDWSWLGLTRQDNQQMNRENEAEKHGGEPMTMWVRCWLKDGSIEELVEEKDGKKEYVQKLKYPHGRYIELAGATLLKDQENGVEINGQVYPYEDGEIPVAKLVNYEIPDKFTGLSEMQFLRGPQKILNYVWSFILDTMKMSSNPKVTVTHQAQEIVDKLSNEPGAIFEVPSQDSVMFHPGDGVPASSFNILDRAQDLMDKAQGIQDATRGGNQQGVTSALMLEGVVEASQTRPRLKGRSIEYFLQSVGFLMVSRIFQFYTSKRIFRITNAEGYPEHIEFYLQDNPAKPGEKIASLRTSQDGVMGPAQTMEVKGLPDVRTSSGSSLPFSKALKSEKALQMYNSQIIDREEVLKATDWPNKEEVLQRMMAKDQQMAEQAAMGAK